MENAKKQMMYAAIGLFLMTIVDLIVFLLPVEVSQNLVVNTATVLMFIALEAWAFVSIFRTSSKGTMLRSGSIVGLVCCAVALLNWVWVLVNPMDSLRFYIAFIPLNILMILAMTTMLLDCKKDVLVSVVGWVYVGLKLLYTVLYLFMPVWFFGWPVFTMVFIGDLLLAAFLFFLSRSAVQLSDSVEKKESTPVENVGLSEVEVPKGLNGFDMGAIVMALFALIGVFYLDDINDSIFYFADGDINPLIYSIFTFLSLAGVLFAMSHLFKMNRFAKGVSETFKTKYGIEISGRPHMTMLLLGGLIALIALMVMFVDTDMSKEIKREGFLSAIFSPLAYETKLVLDILCLGGLLMASAWAMKMNDWKKSLKNVISKQVTVMSSSITNVILLTVAVVAFGLFVYRVVEIISEDKLEGGLFGNYFIHMAFSALLFAATCMLLYFVSNSKRWILELMKVQDQPVKKEEKKEATEEQPAMVSKTDA